MARTETAAEVKVHDKAGRELRLGGVRRRLHEEAGN